MLRFYNVLVLNCLIFTIRSNYSFCDVHTNVLFFIVLLIKQSLGARFML